MKEQEIRSTQALDMYLQLVKRDIANHFSKDDEFTSILCPACSYPGHQEEFCKSGFKYVTCLNCGTLFVNPRPPYQRIIEFYDQADSSSYWVNHFFKPYAEARRNKIFLPRARYLSEVLCEKPGSLFGDVGSGFGIFLEEMQKIWTQTEFIGIEPSTEQVALCRENGLNIIHSSLEEVQGYDNSFDVLTAFELFEHLYDPVAFLEHIYRLLKPGGYFFMTTLNGQGFDIQLLWDKSKSVMPPHHLNFFNPKSIDLLLRKIGFEIVEIATPGKLDWDIVEGMIKSDEFQPERFWNLLIREKDDVCKYELQDWIARHKLSSHMRVLARKGVDGK